MEDILVELIETDDLILETELYVQNCKDTEGYKEAIKLYRDELVNRSLIIGDTSSKYDRILKAIVMADEVLEQELTNNHFTLTLK